MRRSSWPDGFSDELAAQHPRSTFWHPHAGATVVQEPYQPGEAPEGWIATFSDPDDNYFQLLSPME